MEAKYYLDHDAVRDFSMKIFVLLKKNGLKINLEN